MRIIRFMYPGQLWSEFSRFASARRIEHGEIAMEILPVHSRSYSSKFDPDFQETKDIVPVLLSDGTFAWAICAPGGWHMWVDEVQ